MSNVNHVLASLTHSTITERILNKLAIAFFFHLLLLLLSISFVIATAADVVVVEHSGYV